MENKNGNKKGLVIFLRILLVLVILAVIAIAGIIFLYVMKKDSLFSKNDITETQETTEITTAMTTEVTTEITTEAVVEEIATASDADAESKKRTPDSSWMKSKKIYNPQMTKDTISLPHADLTIFDKYKEMMENEENEDTPTPDPTTGQSVGPWEEVTIALDSVDGSINYSSPGDPVKTQKMTSTYMVLMDLDTDTIVAERECDKIVSPASMTKVLTVLTARDYIDESDLDDTFVITKYITDYVKKNDCSAVGFMTGDEVTVRDLLYGTILCSGGDAALGLAEYCAGSQMAFVEHMNEKVEELGLSETAHFTNVVGIYHDDLRCTMKDMAVIMSVALQDDLLKDMLSKRTYVTEITYPDLDLPDGIEISNWFLRRIEDKETAGNVIAAKTGFVNEAGCCAVSYYESNKGKRYICVTGNSFSSWRTIYDHVAVYRSFTE